MSWSISFPWYSVIGICCFCCSQTEVWSVPWWFQKPVHCPVTFASYLASNTIITRHEWNKEKKSSHPCRNLLGLFFLIGENGLKNLNYFHSITITMLPVSRCIRNDYLCLTVFLPLCVCLSTLSPSPSDCSTDPGLQCAGWLTCDCCFPPPCFLLST